MKLDTASVITGLLHDTVEDTLATLEVIEAEFGAEIAQLVDGVTKIGKIQFRSKEEQQVRVQCLNKKKEKKNLFFFFF